MGRYSKEDTSVAFIEVCTGLFSITERKELEIENEFKKYNVMYSQFACDYRKLKPQPADAPNTGGGGVDFSEFKDTVEILIETYAPMIISGVIIDLIVEWIKYLFEEAKNKLKENQSEGKIKFQITIKRKTKKAKKEIYIEGETNDGEIRKWLENTLIQKQ